MKTITKFIYFGFAALALACFTLSQTVRAVVPAPDGGYPNGNTAEGTDALFALTMGANNTAIGYNALFSNSTGNDNAALGVQALQSATTANGNTAIGAYALIANTTGSLNTVIGAAAAVSNTTGHDNTAVGLNTLYSNIDGINNTAVGRAAMGANTNGGNNTAIGWYSLNANTVGNLNTANGVYALLGNTTGNCNTANGSAALYLNATGSSNTASGFLALFHSSGSNNVGVGASAGSALATGNNNVCIGAGVSGSPGESNTTRIRNVYSSVASGRAVYVNADNKIGTLSSSRRYKQEIKPMDKASELLFALKPVTFRYRKDVDPSGALAFGLIAEDVAQTSPELITRDENGSPQTVRYEAINAMLLNEFLKEHKMVMEQGAIIEKQRNDFETAIAKQQKEICTLTAIVKQQAAQLQKVSAQMELNKTGSQEIALKIP